MVENSRYVLIFVDKAHVVGDDDSDDELYNASRDRSPVYSGSDNDVPLQRSPHLLRSKPRAAPKKGRGKTGKPLMQITPSAMS